MTIHRRQARSIVMLVLPLIAPLTSRAVSSDDVRVTLDTIIKAWDNRAKKIESFDFRWWSKRSNARQEHPPEAKNVSPEEVRPKPESSFIWRYRFANDAKGRGRLEE